MRQFTQQISIKAHGRKLYDITPLVLNRGQRAWTKYRAAHAVHSAHIGQPID